MLIYIWNTCQSYRPKFRSSISRTNKKAQSAVSIMEGLALAIRAAAEPAAEPAAAPAAAAPLYGLLTYDRRDPLSLTASQWRAEMDKCEAARLALEARRPDPTAEARHDSAEAWRRRVRARKAAAEQERERTAMMAEEEMQMAAKAE